ncbi:MULTISPECIES: Imm26 family immunity protein [unclassified Duganella]|uniref:Imm26 family immunity protein n=1 Tax=unclassified Duganella TaxID=2636909 RepID=UPI000AF45F2B|nr:MULTISPECIES: Imm26 family immunity protein [unclassified Duganella]
MSKVKPGDLFYVPATNKECKSGFVIGRYIELVPTNAGHLIEVFARFYTELPKSIDEVDKSQRLFRPIMCSLRFEEIPKWKVLFSDPSYDTSQSDYGSIAIAFDTKLWSGGKSRSATKEELQEFEDSTCWRMHHIVFRVNAHLAGIFGPNDCYDYHRVPKGLRVDDPAAKEEVIALAEAMDARFKNWEDVEKARRPRKPLMGQS